MSSPLTKVWFKGQSCNKTHKTRLHTEEKKGERKKLLLFSFNSEANATTGFLADRIFLS